MPETTPAQQAEAAANARKEGEEKAKTENKTPAVVTPPAPQPIQGSPTSLQK